MPTMRVSLAIAALTPVLTSTSCTGDKDVSCPTLSCGFCGQNVGGCLGSACADEDFDHDLTDCSGGQCHYHCTCRAPTPPTPAPTPVPPSPTPTPTPTPSPTPTPGPSVQCPGQNLLPTPADPSEYGPWPVSSRVVAGDPAHNDVS